MYYVSQHHLHLRCWCLVRCRRPCTWPLSLAVMLVLVPYEEHWTEERERAVTVRNCQFLTAPALTGGVCDLHGCAMCQQCILCDKNSHFMLQLSVGCASTRARACKCKCDGGTSLTTFMNFDCTYRDVLPRGIVSYCCTHRVTHCIALIVNAL